MSTKHMAKITSGIGRAPERRVAAPGAPRDTHAPPVSRGRALLETRECVFDAPLGTAQPGHKK